MTVERSSFSMRFLIDTPCCALCVPYVARLPPTGGNEIWRICRIIHKSSFDFATLIVNGARIDGHCNHPQILRSASGASTPDPTP